MKLKYSLKGLDCANCAQKVQERVSKLENVRECSVVFATTKMFVETDTDLFDESKIVEAVKSVEPDVEVINLSKMVKIIMFLIITKNVTVNMITNIIMITRNVAADTSMNITMITRNAAVDMTMSIILNQFNMVI